LGKPASLHATTGFLASNVYAGQHPKPHIGSYDGKSYIGSSDRDHYISSQTKTLNCFIRLGLVLLTGKATLLPTLFFALHKQDSASGSFKQQFF